MSLNAYVTAEGGEIARAQGVQAEAAGIEATAEMNPILLKPKGGALAEAVIRGKSWKDISAATYWMQEQPGLWQAVVESLARLQESFEVLVIEGAGSPAEINLRGRDLTNMAVAALADAPVVLVADIDRGGVFASLVGTCELLTDQERLRIKGFVINKFRGDVRILTPGLDFLEARTGCPVLGVLPYLEDLGIEAEDSVGLGGEREKPDADLDLAVLRLPQISNFSDFEPFLLEPDVAVRYVRHPAALGRPDVLFIPGTKNTMRDLAHLYASGWAETIKRFAEGGGLVVGICGGYQMLGHELHDPLGCEDGIRRLPGLGLLDVTTVFRANKTTRRVAGYTLPVPGPLGAVHREQVTGYEIHFGETWQVAGDPPTRPADPLTRVPPGTPNGDSQVPRAVFSVRDGEMEFGEGAVDTAGGVWGSYLHGVFEADGFRRRWLNAVREHHGLAPGRRQAVSFSAAKDDAFDRLAAVVRRHLDLEKVYGWLGLPSPGGMRDGHGAD
jgi:adenosylcobyric acid synthase